MLQDGRRYPGIGNEVAPEIPGDERVSQHLPLFVGGTDFGARGVEQGVDERYGVRDGIGIDEDTRIRDDSQETGDDRQGQGERTVSSRAVLSGVIERMNCCSMVLVSGVGMRRPAR